MINSETIICEASRRHLCSSLLSHYLTAQGYNDTQQYIHSHQSWGQREGRRYFTLTTNAKTIREIEGVQAAYVCACLKFSCEFFLWRQWTAGVSFICHETVNAMMYKWDYLQPEIGNANIFSCPHTTGQQHLYLKWEFMHVLLILYRIQPTEPLLHGWLNRWLQFYYETVI